MNEDANTLDTMQYIMSLVQKANPDQLRWITIFLKALLKE